MIAGLPLIVKYGAVALALLIFIWILSKAFKGERLDEREQTKGDADADRATAFRRRADKSYNNPDDNVGRVLSKDEWPVDPFTRVSTSVVEDLSDRDDEDG